jgi:hypothetical protein
MGNVVRQENYRLIGKMGTPEHEEYELERVGDLILLIQQARKQRNMTQEEPEKQKNVNFLVRINHRNWDREILSVVEVRK